MIRGYDVIRNGHTLGLFNLSAGMRKAIATIKPTNFDDVSALRFIVWLGKIY